ncbi:DNA replication/repair protein RecF [Jatrophihabitans sp. YIM 134969]
MYLRHLSLLDFRSWPSAELALRPGATALVGSNGQGKTNLLEAVGYLSTLSSHRTGVDAPLVRAGAEAATVRGAVVSDGRELRLEVTITPGRANKARINTTALPRARDLTGVLRTVVFAPEDLAIVRGDPTERRRFLDDLLVTRSPRFAGVRADYDRTLKQRTTLLKSALGARRGGRTPDLSTLDVWNDHLASHGAELTASRTALVADLAGPAAGAYAALAPGARLGLAYRPAALEHVETTAPDPGDAEAYRALLLAAMAAARPAELERGVSLVGPHRDDLVLTLASSGAGELPVRGYASHGESWSVALALRLGSLELLRADGGEPVLLLDDVFAELDVARRDHLVGVARDSEQVLVTAAVDADVPAGIAGDRVDVRDGVLTARPEPS